MMKPKISTVLSLVLASLLFAGMAASADTLPLTLTTPFQTGASGDTLTFEATVTEPGTAPVFLNGDAVTLAGSLILDDSQFLSGFPLSMNQGDIFTGDLFTVFILPGTPAGLYSGTFTILGGSDGSAQDVLGSADFNVEVSATPEPSSLLLCASGLLGIMLTFRSRRFRT